MCCSEELVVVESVGACLVKGEGWRVRGGRSARLGCVMLMDFVSSGHSVVKHTTS